jgi:hypothetical protein
VRRPHQCLVRPATEFILVSTNKPYIRRDLQFYLKETKGQKIDEAKESTLPSVGQS